MQGLSRGARPRAARMRPRGAATLVPAAPRALRDARRDRGGERRRLCFSRAVAERLLHAGAPQGRRRHRRLRSGIFPLLRGFRLERALEPYLRERLRTLGEERALLPPPGAPGTPGPPPLRQEAAA